MLPKAACILSPLLFNVLVDAVVRYWYSIVMETMAKGDAVGDRTSLFYADNGAIGSRDPKWLQDATQFLCDLFRNCISLKVNTKKTKVMVCFPGPIRGRLSEAGYKRRHRHQGETFRQRKKRRVACSECGKDLAAGSLPIHLRTIHGIANTCFFVEEPC